TAHRSPLTAHRPGYSAGYSAGNSVSSSSVNGSGPTCITPGRSEADRSQQVREIAPMSLIGPRPHPLAHVGKFGAGAGDFDAGAGGAGRGADEAPP
ncbi:hypothetical protein, partial [Streptomyces sp. SID3343]|uniref:hypothetical protein n=1 Tax=Streptomyces sp. SID3343 TaxID=2690260 RepID=UPI0013C17519